MAEVTQDVYAPSTVSPMEGKLRTITAFLQKKHVYREVRVGTHTRARPLRPGTERYPSFSMLRLITKNEVAQMDKRKSVERERANNR